MNKFYRLVFRSFFLIYRYTLSPTFSAFGVRCRFTPSCSLYAEEALYRHGVLKGVYLASTRVLRCQAFCTPGYDPVPPKAPSLKR